MCERIKVGYLGIGRGLPERILTNAHLEKMVDTSDEWIIQRTGIRERRILGPNESIASLSISAAKAAIEHSGIDPSKIRYIRIGVNTHMRFPSLASIVQEELGILDASASDIAAGCTSFIYSVEDIFNHLQTEWMLYGNKSYGLAIGVDAMSYVTDWTDRSTCVLFGDAAGAAVIGPVESGEILATYTRMQGKYGKLLKQDETLSNLLDDPLKMTFKHPQTTVYPYLLMEGRKVFAVAVRTMVADIQRVIAKYNSANGEKLTEDDVDFVIPHQANMRIVNAVGEALKLPSDKVHKNTVMYYGNCSAATIPVAYVDEWGKRPGALEIDVAFGAGFASGAILRRMADKQE